MALKPKAAVSVWLTDDFWATITVLIVIPVLIYFVFKKRTK